MNPVSAAYLAAAVSSNQKSLTKIEIWTGPTATSQPRFIQDVTQFLNVATWSEDETQSPRRTCSVTLESRGSNYDDLVPLTETSLLHPLSGNELRIFKGFQYADGSSEYAPCGVYRMSKPAITDDGTEIEIVINGSDRSYEVNRRQWTAPYPISTFPKTDAAVLAILQLVMPGLTYNLTPSTYTVPSMTLGSISGGGGSGPFADCISLETAASQELFFDAVGVVVGRVVPDPTTSPLTISFLEGANCVVSEAQRVFDETQTFNGVQVTGSGAGVVFPVQETVWVTDPTSPLFPAVFGYVPFFYTSALVTTGPQATACATALLQKLLTAYDDVSFTAVPNAALTCGDVIALQRQRIGISDTFCISSISFSSDVKQPMQVTCRTRSSAA